MVGEGEMMPDLFSDPLYLRSSYWSLSTSAIWSKHFPSYGWGEVSGSVVVFGIQLMYFYSCKVVPDGFGVAYMTGYDGKYDTSSNVKQWGLNLILRSSTVHSDLSQGDAECKVCRGDCASGE